MTLPKYSVIESDKECSATEDTRKKIMQSVISNSTSTLRNEVFVFVREKLIGVVYDLPSTAPLIERVQIEFPGERAIIIIPASR